MGSKMHSGSKEKPHKTAENNTKIAETCVGFPFWWVEKSPIYNASGIRIHDLKYILSDSIFRLITVKDDFIRYITECERARRALEEKYGGELSNGVSKLSTKVLALTR